jgi:prevent-host-death family protein
MRIATIREVQHHLRDVLGWVAAGQSVEVTQRGRVVARITPPAEVQAVEWPDFGARLKKHFPRGVKGKPLSQIILEDREERI